MKAFEIPAEPDTGEYQGEAATYYRYEDVAQDGRLRIEGIWPGMGRALWVKAGVAEPLRRMAADHGIRSVLTRVVLLGGDVPISPHERAASRVRYQLDHDVDAAGTVSRILMSSWLRTDAPRRASKNPVSRGTGDPVLVARAYGQHVFTKPLEKPPAHRVLALDDRDLPPVPPRRGRWLAPEELLRIPDGAQPLEDGPRLDPAPIVFGLVHTDGNHHVNFLTYPRLLEDAALRRLADFDTPRRLLARKAELGYRKPCFAGERVRILSQAFKMGDAWGIAAAYVEEPADAISGGGFADFGKPRCTARILLTE